MAKWNRAELLLLKCPQCGKDFSAKKFKKWIKKYCSVQCYSDSRKGLKRDPQVAARASFAMKKALKDPVVRKKISLALLGKKRSEKTKKTLSEMAIKRLSENGIKPTCTRYTSLKTGREEIADSSYELLRFKALDQSPLIKSWTKKHGIRIIYSVNGKKHRYLPDILIYYNDGKKVLEEVKGRIWNHSVFAMKNLYAVSYCMMHGMQFRLIFKEQLNEVL